MNGATASSNRTLVWDVFVRVFHWSLVAAVSLAALTGFLLGATWIDTHIWAGGAAAALILTRIIWGVIGTTYARFSSFVVGPRAAWQHLQELREGKAARHLGHNPLGGLMIVGIMVVVTALAITGLVVLGGVFKTGPLGFANSYATARNVMEMHELLAVGFMLLIGSHIGGAIYESRRTHENLPRSMVNGHKERRSGDHEVAFVKGHPIVLAALAVVTISALIWGGNTLAEKPAQGVPSASLDPVYADECSACHMAFHPSLLPAKSWTYLMANLDNHFDEDASLATDTAAELSAWLSANAAETADTKPANVFRQTSASAPDSITQTQFWRRTHHRIPEALFSRAPIYSNTNCAACHSDAKTGLFYPANISIPKEDQK